MQILLCPEFQNATIRSRRLTMKVAFVTDTGTGMSSEQWKQEGIYCFPLQIECDGISYDELETMNYHQFIQNLHQKKIM